jgi:sec-independent protein translocase protein TatA
VHLPGVFQLLVIALIAVVLFGRGRISDFMGDVGKGVKSFRKSIADDDEAAHPAGIGIEPAVAEAAEPPPAADQIHQ